MLCYRRLNLPLNPVKDLDSIISQVNTDKAQDQYQMVNVDPASTLTDEVLEAFDQLNLVPESATVFYFTVPKPESKSLLHSDIVRNGDKWKPVVCGVNWELNNINAKLSWWETKKIKFYPKDASFFWFNPHGIHYNGRFSLGVSDTLDKRIDSVDTLESPLLVRTDIPHNVYLPEQEFTTDTRYSISVRFHNDFLNWDNAVKHFAPITI